MRRWKESKDANKEIVKKAGASIPDLFARHGEAYFRALEKETIAELSKKSGAVIATGGGAVLRDENVDALRAVYNEGYGEEQETHYLKKNASEKEGTEAIDLRIGHYETDTEWVDLYAVPNADNTLRNCNRC